MKLSVSEFLQLIQKRIQADANFCIAIDGFGASGKSTLAKLLQASKPESVILHADEFCDPPETEDENFNWDRFEDEVVGPLLENPPVVPVIIEGVYCTQPRFAEVYDLRIWVETPEEVRLARAMARDGEEKREMWEKVWLPFTREYKEKHRPHERAHFVVDGHLSDFAADEIVIMET